MKAARKLFRLVSLGITAIAIVIAAGLLIAPAQVWKIIAGDPDLGTVNFVTLKKTAKPNQYLLCPENLCKETTADAQSQTYALSVEALKKAFDLASSGEQYVTKVDESERTLRYVVRTPTLQYPDTVSVEFFDVNGGSTLAVYSRSQIGHSDFGVNRKRIEDWMQRLEKSLQ